MIARTKEGTATKMTDELRVRGATPQAAGAETAMGVTAEDVKAALEAKLQSALEEARARQPQIAEPLNWWEIYSVGPIQPGAGLVPPSSFFDSPLLPNKVIRAGQTAYIATVIILNPFPLVQDPNIIPSDYLSIWGLPYSVEYHTANVTDVKSGPADLNVKHTGMHLVPGQSYYVDILEFTARDEGCVFETNICARILGCDGYQPSASPFAGFARTTVNLDPELFFPTQELEFDNPLRFMVYE